jgi:phosphatidylglycerol:prolipoprotein diacylglycerol transferase
MLAAAFLVSTWLATQQAKRQNVNPDAVFNLAFLAFIFGIIGARIFYVIENLAYYVKNPLETVMLQHGGLSWFGGLLSGVIIAVWYLRVKNLPVYKILDLISPFVSLAQAIGRIGCLLNGCCYGKISDYGLYFPVHNAILVPVQLYSSLILILIFITLRYLQDRPHKQGQIFFTYLLLYSTKRFFVEFLRADNERIFLGLTLFQIIAVAIFAFSAVKLILYFKSKQ